jgi:hypothetical protein
MTDFRKLRVGDTFEYRTESTEGLVMITTYRIVQASLRSNTTTEATARVVECVIYNNGVRITIDKETA